MPAPHIATPTWPLDGDFDAAAARYGEAYADYEATLDAAAGLPPTCSRAARPARVEAATAAALRYYVRLATADDDLPVLVVSAR